MTKPNADALQVIARNRRATFDYEILERVEAGLELTGSEVKSLRNGKGTIAEAYVRISDGQAWLVGANIQPYAQASYNNHEPDRRRRLLLHKRQILKLERAAREKGVTLVPMALYFRGAWVKLEFGLARGKKLHDKRESIKQKEHKREKDRALRER